MISDSSKPFGFRDLQKRTQSFVLFCFALLCFASPLGICCLPNGGGRLPRRTRLRSGVSSSSRGLVGDVGTWKASRSESEVRAGRAAGLRLRNLIFIDDDLPFFEVISSFAPLESFGTSASEADSVGNVFQSSISSRRTIFFISTFCKPRQTYFSPCLPRSFALSLSDLHLGGMVRVARVSRVLRDEAIVFACRTANGFHLLFAYNLSLKDKIMEFQAHNLLWHAGVLLSAWGMSGSLIIYNFRLFVISVAIIK